MHRKFIYFAVLLLLLCEGFRCQVRFERPQNPQNGRNCQRGSQCVPVNRCPAIRNQPNWRSTVTRCRAVSVRPSGRICCPVMSEVIDEGRRAPVVPSVMPNTPASAPVNPTRRTDCGISRTGGAQASYVMGGEISEQGQWPWMVAITMVDSSGRQDLWCTGFLITRRHVLSAAHCFDRPEVSLYETRIGNVDWRQSQVYTIQSIKVHEGYTVNRYYDDIAVLTLARNVDDPSVGLVCLPTGRIGRRNLSGRGVSVAGWGADRAGGAMSNVLRHLHAIPVMPNDECNRFFNERLRSFRTQFPNGITDGFICAGFPEGGRDSCGGDSGGPLMLEVRDRWYAIGIVSFGYDCGRPEYPAGYTRIASHLDWIARNTGR